MKQVDITTAHNIVVTHQLATLPQRIIATLIDIAIQTFFIILVFSAMGNHTLTYLVVGPVPLLYQLLFEVFNQGQSIGKRALRTRVVSLRGMRPGLDELLVRWAFRLIDVAMSGGMVAIISILGSPKGQRIGDLLARTTVISLDSKRGFSLKEINSLRKEDYEIVYPAVVLYSDEDMLLVKEALQRVRLQSTHETRMFVQKVAKRVARDLDVDVGDSKTDFLRTVLEDYILLTR